MRRKGKSNFPLYSIGVLLTYLFLEIIGRVGGMFLGLPFWQPKNIYLKKYYPEVRVVMDSIESSQTHDINVLILGGSVISNLWSKSDQRLDSLLSPSFPSKNLRFYNVALPGHTSYDNLIKYKLLKGYPFQLVIYYEAINENRVNNIPTNSFHPDYSHMKWFEELGILGRHPEINYTILPYIIDRSFVTIKSMLTHKIYINETYVPKEYHQYASEIRTAPTYKKNIAELVSLVQERKEKVLLMTYASFFPDVKLENKKEIYAYFAGCKFASAMDLWGNPYNVKKGIAIHNQELMAVARKNNLTYLDMATIMPANRLFFCDICHLSDAGATFFCEQIKQEIIKKKYLK